MSKRLWTLLIVCLLAEQVSCKGIFSSSRGSSGARHSPSTGRSGIFGSRSSHSGMGGISRQNGGYRQNNMGSGGFIGSSRNHGTGWRNSGYRHHNTPRFSKGSGIGSVGRSSTFKTMLVGAAAGYLTYQAGKYMIRSAMAPMMWNNRPYYWGANHYQSAPGRQMCRMPVDPSDPQLGNVYFSDQSRPREIVWGCGMNEQCCGYECCPMTGGGGMGGYGPSYPSTHGSYGGAGAMGVGAAGASESMLGHGLSVRPSQSIGVQGQLRCNGLPAAGVLVKLYDHDTFTIDDKIASGRTDAQGNFLLAGHAHEYTTITPKFNVYHDCNDWLPCQRKISVYIPKDFVTRGTTTQRVYNVGMMELAGHFENESRDCIH